MHKKKFIYFSNSKSFNIFSVLNISFKSSFEYGIPFIQHYLNSILFDVNVPVLSENTYSILPNSSWINVFSTLNGFYSLDIYSSNSIHVVYKYFNVSNDIINDIGTIEFNNKKFEK